MQKKNIIICCDGTDNKLTVDANTNVLHFYSCLKRSSDQLLYYNPGVGIIWTKSKLKLFKKLNRLIDQVKAVSLTRDVIDAYKYLMDTHESGDKIYLIGFSRGAYTVRMLSGLLEMYGLLFKGNESHLDYLLEIYYLNDEDKWQIANKFKNRFSVPVKIEFMGIWDTVISVGSIFKSYNAFPYSTRLKNVKILRHAVSIDDRRKHFKPSLISKEHENAKEVWFAGVHSDVGGGYKEEGLSKIALEWMLIEAKAAGVKTSTKMIQRYLYGKDSEGKDVKGYLPPNHMAQPHNSFKANLNWLMDFLPRKKARILAQKKVEEKVQVKAQEKTQEREKEKLEYYYDFDYYPLRKIKDKSIIHESVQRKIKEDKTYKPANIKIDKLYVYSIEKWDKDALKVKE